LQAIDDYDYYSGFHIMDNKSYNVRVLEKINKKAVPPQGNRAMPQLLFFSV